jgi:hypothetical protein
MMMAANTSSLSKTRRVENSHPGSLLDAMNYALVEVDEFDHFDDSYTGEGLFAHDDFDQLIQDETAANKMNDPFNDIHSHSSSSSSSSKKNNKLTSFASPTIVTRHMSRTNVNDPYSGYYLTDPDLSYLPRNSSAGGWTPRDDRNLLARQIYGHVTPDINYPAAVSPEHSLSRSLERFQGPSFHPVPGIDETIPIDLSREMSGEALFFDPWLRFLPVTTCTDADAVEDEDKEDQQFLMSMPRSMSVGTTTTVSRVSYSNNNDTNHSRIPPSVQVNQDAAGATINKAPTEVEAPSPKKRTMDKISPVGAKNHACRTRADSPQVTTMKLPHRPTKKRRKARSTRYASSELNTGVATASDETNSPATCTAPETDAEDETNNVDSGMQVSNPCMRREVRPVRFRLYHAEQWSEKLNDLKDFISEYGHAMVPHNYAPDPELSRWAKVCVSSVREHFRSRYCEFAHYLDCLYSFALITFLLFQSANDTNTSSTNSKVRQSHVRNDLP